MYKEDKCSFLHLFWFPSLAEQFVCGPSWAVSLLWFFSYMPATDLGRVSAPYLLRGKTPKESPIWTWTGSSLGFCGSRKELCIQSFFFRWMWRWYIQLPFCPSSRSCWEALLKDVNIHQSHSHCIILKGMSFSQDLESEKSRLSGLSSYKGPAEALATLSNLKTPPILSSGKGSCLPGSLGQLSLSQGLLCHQNVPTCAPFWLATGWCRWDLLLVTGISKDFGQG